MRDRKNSAVHPLTFFLAVYLFFSMPWLFLFDGEQYHELFSVLSVAWMHCCHRHQRAGNDQHSSDFKTIAEELAVTRPSRAISGSLRFS
jgi:hypothetical protein